MNLKYTIISSFDSIYAHKMRSFLTILGILIGVASIIAVMSIGQGATNLIVSEIDKMGASTVIVIPTPGGSDMMDVFYAELLTERDFEALKRTANVPNLESIMPIAIVPGSVRSLNELYRGAMVIGASSEFFGETFNIRPGGGADFTESDIQARSRVAVIGIKVKEEIFGQSDALGESIIIGDVRFRVVGVYPAIGQRGIFNIDELVIIPYSTAQVYILGSNEFDRFVIRADSPSNVDRVAFDVSATLRETRKVNEGDEDFMVMTQQGLRGQIGNVMGILTGFISFIVSIALLVGGIGIMNIMLVSVTERTKEIGLRKALGATRSAILKQFLWEAVILTVWGGILGIIFGAFISLVASFVLSEFFDLSWSFVFPVSAAVLGVGASALVGLVFGIYPAKKAADLSPVEALQYE